MPSGVSALILWDVPPELSELSVRLLWGVPPILSGVRAPGVYPRYDSSAGLGGI